jgi:hypothetical protein
VRAHLSHLFHRLGSDPFDTGANISRYNRTHLLSAFDSFHEIKKWKGMTINDFPMRKSVSAQPRRRRYRVYNPNDDPEFDPELGSTDDLGAEGRGLGGNSQALGSQGLEDSRVRTLHGPNSPALPSIIALDSQLEDSREMGEMEDSRGMAARENSWEPEDSRVEPEDSQGEFYNPEDSEEDEDLGDRPTSIQPTRFLVPRDQVR